MAEVGDRIDALDTSLFSAIRSQTSKEDRLSLLLIQRCVRKAGPYTYLEIGSFLGGTLQPYYVDPLCTTIYSIDKRPAWSPDERGSEYQYEDNTAEVMLRNLRETYPSASEKVLDIQSDARDVDPRKIAERPSACFIDGEHTNEAVYSDFIFCLSVCAPNAVIAFHDAWIVAEGIKTIRDHLRSQSVPHKGMVLAGNVYAIVLNDSATPYAAELETISQNEAVYFARGKKLLRRLRIGSFKGRLIVIFPRLYRVFKWCKTKWQRLKQSGADYEPPS